MRSMRSRKPLLAVVSVFIAVLVFLISGWKRDSDRYNVIVVSLDTLRADHLGILGFSKWDISPNIDQLASDGVVFENAFSTASVTTASHMAIFTGLYPLEHRISDVNAISARKEELPGFLDTKIKTLPQLFRESGFRTVRFVNSRDYFLDASIGFGRGFDELFPFGMDSLASTKAISDWVKENSGKPFFAFIHSKRPHGPFLFSDRELEAARLKGIINKNYSGPIVSSFEKWSELTEKNFWANNFIPGIVPDCYFFDDKVRRNVSGDVLMHRQLYALGVHKADEYLGRIVSALKESGIYEKTLILVTSDHGEQLLERGSFSHIHLFREETHVPLVIRFPLDLRKGIREARVASDVQSVDILPTLAKVSGVSMPENISGKDLSPLWRKEKSELREYSHGWNSFSLIRRSAFLRSKKWVLVQENGNFSLFDRENDAEEKINVAKSNPEVLQKMEEKLDEFRMIGTSFDPERSR